MSAFNEAAESAERQPRQDEPERQHHQRMKPEDLQSHAFEQDAFADFDVMVEGGQLDRVL